MQPNGRTIIIIKIVRSSSSRYHIVGRDERPFSRISRHLTPSLFPLSLLLILSLFLFISYIENAHTFQLTRQSLMLQNACILFSIFILYCTLTVRPTNVFEAQNYQYDGSLVEFVALQFVKLIFFFSNLKNSSKRGSLPTLYQNTFRRRELRVFIICIVSDDLVK